MEAVLASIHPTIRGGDDEATLLAHKMELAAATAASMAKKHRPNHHQGAPRPPPARPIEMRKQKECQEERRMDRCVATYGSLRA